MVHFLMYSVPLLGHVYLSDYWQPFPLVDCPLNETLGLHEFA
jgi:hypothetical protein